jgi:hypothetical protein
VYLVKPLSYDIKLDGQATDWGWFKELPEKLRIVPLPNSGPNSQARDILTGEVPPGSGSRAR